MNLSPRKLSLAHRLLVDLLAAGAQPVASCLDRAAEVGISMRTLYEARKRLPIECIGRPGFSPGWWRLAGSVTSPPEEWKRRKLRHCISCGVSLEGQHWKLKRCRACGGRPSKGVYS